MSTLNFAMIGCGKLARTHAQCLEKIQGAQFTAYCDVNAAAAESLLSDFGGEYATTDPKRIMDDASIHAVYICTRHDTHASLAIQAASAGKHIFCEKPLALTAESCEAIARAVEQSGVFFMSAFKLRYYPLVIKAKAFIPRPQVVVGQVMDERWPDDIWPMDPVQGGGNVHSQGCHATDLLRYFAGSEPRTVYAAGGMMTHPGHACIDQCVATITFENGTVASWIQGDAGLPGETSKFHFGLFADNKSVQLSDRFKRATFNDNGRIWTEESEEEEGFAIENKVFVEALQAGKQPELTVYDGLQATRLVLAADRSIRTGCIEQL